MPQVFKWKKYLFERKRIALIVLKNIFYILLFFISRSVESRNVTFRYGKQICTPWKFLHIYSWNNFLIFFWLFFPQNQIFFLCERSVWQLFQTPLKILLEEVTGKLRGQDKHWASLFENILWSNVFIFIINDPFYWVFIMFISGQESHCYCPFPYCLF